MEERLSTQQVGKDSERARSVRIEAEVRYDSKRVLRGSVVYSDGKLGHHH